MRWPQAGVLVLSTLVMTGCPSEFGKDGRVAKAIHKDTVDMVIKVCSEQRHNEVCGNGKERTQACLDCGGPRK
jgi:hypothetical protein